VQGRRPAERRASGWIYLCACAYVQSERDDGIFIRMLIQQSRITARVRRTMTIVIIVVVVVISWAHPESSRAPR